MQYVFAFLCCTAVFVSRLALEPLLREHSPLLLFALAVAVCAVHGGFGPGIFATVLGGLGALFFFPPTGGFWVAPEYRSTVAIQLAVFFVVGAILSWVGGELRRLRWNAVRLANERNEILESVTDGFEALDADCRFLYQNRAAARLHGSPPGSILGKTIWEVLPDLHDTTVEQEFRLAMKRRAVAHFEYQFPSTKRWFEFHVHPAVNGGLTVYFREITDRKTQQSHLRETLQERDAALDHVRLLRGLLPICASCKKIRDEGGGWQQLEVYISEHSQAKFSHGLCPDCAERLFAAEGFYFSASQARNSPSGSTSSQ